MNSKHRWLAFLALLVWGLGYVALFAFFRLNSEDFIERQRKESLCSDAACPRVEVPWAQPMLGLDERPPFLLAGWGGLEEDGVWSIARSASLYVPLAAESAQCMELSLRISVAGPAPQWLRMRFANGDRAGGWRLSSSAGPVDISVEMPVSRLDQRHALYVSMELPDATVPAKVSESRDTRLLGIKLHAVSIRRSVSMKSACGQ